VKHLLITGGCGFIGHHVVEHFLKNTGWQISVIDALTYASNGFDRVRDIQAFDDRRCRFYAADLAHPVSIGVVDELGPVDYIFHMAAETHVDRSVSDPMRFVVSNVVGTCNALEMARKVQPKLFLYFSTDEVFGPAFRGIDYREWDRYASANPYAATKAGGEELTLAYGNTYGLPVAITHTMNCFGERQHPEKYIPMCIRKILAGETITVHADKTKTVPGCRSYIHCRNVAQALHFLAERFEPGDKYNIVGEHEINNLDLALYIGTVLGRRVKYELVDFHSSRPGHDLRYSLSGRKMQDMGWQPPVGFFDSLTKTVEWTVNNERWLNAV